MATDATIDISFEKYRSYVNALRQQHETKPLPLACLRILDGVNEKIWRDSSVPPYKPSVKENLLRALVKILKTTEGTQEVGRLFRSIVEDTQQLIDRSYFLIQTPVSWKERSGYRLLTRSIKRLMERAQKQERIHTFNKLLKELAERRGRKIPFIYGDFVGCAMDLVVYEESNEPGMAGPSLFKCIWTQSWTNFEERKAQLLARRPVRTVVPVTNQVIYNASLVELLDPVTELVWDFDDDEGTACELRWRIVDSLDPALLPVEPWPVARDDEVPFHSDIVLAGGRDKRLMGLTSLIHNLVRLRLRIIRTRVKEEKEKLEKAPSAQPATEHRQHALAAFTAVSRRSLKRQAILSL